MRGIGSADVAVLVFEAYDKEDFYFDSTALKWIKTKDLALCAFAMGIKQIIVAFNIGSWSSHD